MSASAPVRHSRRGRELLARASDQRPGAASGREVERLEEWLAGSPAAARPAQRRPPLEQRASSLQHRRRVPERGHRLVEQLDPIVPAGRESDDAQRHPEGARRSEGPHVRELVRCQLPRALALAETQQCEGRTRASVQVADIAHRRPPDRGAEHLGAGLEVAERGRGLPLGQPEPAPRGRDQHGADSRRPAGLGKQREQRLRLLELAGLDGDIGQHGRGERKSGSEVAVLQHAQGDSRGGVRLRKRAESQLEQPECCRSRRGHGRCRSG